MSFSMKVKLRNTGRGVAVQPAIRFRGLSDRLVWRSPSGLKPGWTIAWSIDSPPPDQVIYLSEPDVVVYPGLDAPAIEVGHSSINSGSGATIAIRGELYCRDMHPIPFAGDATSDVEVILPLGDAP